MALCLKAGDPPSYQHPHSQLLIELLGSLYHITGQSLLAGCVQEMGVAVLRRKLILSVCFYKEEVIKRIKLVELHVHSKDPTGVRLMPRFCRSPQEKTKIALERENSLDIRCIELE